MNTKARTNKTKRGTSDSLAPGATPTPGATMVSESPPEVSSRREVTTPMRPPSLKAPEGDSSVKSLPPTPSAPVIAEAAGLTPTPPPSQGGRSSRRPARSRTGKTPAPDAVASQPPTPTPPPVDVLLSEAPPAVSARGGSTKKSSRRPRHASKKGTSIEPAPLTEASPAPRVGLESGGWRKPESRGHDEPSLSHAAADVDESFFADGEKGPSHRAKSTFSDLDEVDPDLRTMLKNAPGAQRRRERYARFVRWVVVAGVAVLTAGLVRVAIAKREYQPVQRPAAVAPAKAEPVAVDPPAVAPQAAQLTGNPAAEAPPATAEQASAQPDAPKAAEESAASTASAPTEANPEEAKKAKKESQHLLEIGKAKDSIEAGERAVALDPTDAESWLILGAAYQQIGKLADARRCFKSCLTLGTHGPKGECAAMPH